MTSAHQQLGDYHLLEKIATGGMAEVYRARASGLAGFQKILVIKRILPSLASDEEFIRLFIDEAKIAEAVRHANIVQIFDVNEVNGQYYMALEYVHGLDLARLVARAKDQGPFPVPLALFIVAEVLKALAFAHERRDEEGRPLNVVHCDISPQNILVSYSGEVKITDFGISRAAFQARSLHDVIRGKYAYMSPEQVEGKPLDGRSDLFSLGIVLFELLTGRRLFKAKTRDETIARVRRAEVPSPRAYRPELTVGLEQLLRRSLLAKAADRFPSAQIMLEELGTLIVREGLRATNNDLASYIRTVVESADQRERAKGPLEPQSVVVVAAEASPPPRSLANPRHSLAVVTQEWSALIEESGGEVWEHSDGSMLVCWVGGDLRETLGRAVRTTQALRAATQRSGYRLSAGVAPGVARVDPVSKRPADGWELAGPFYLARWMLNLSAHRGRPLLTEVGARHVGEDQLSLLGRISILGNRYINLYELD